MEPPQLLSINLVAAVALALPLAFEAPEPDVMRRPPRDPREPVLSRFVVRRTGVAAVVVLQGAFVYAPPFRAVFETAPLSLRDLALSAAVGAIILPVIAVVKVLESRRDVG